MEAEMTMKKMLSLRLGASLSALLLSTLFLCAPAANAQVGIGISKTLYRFVTQNSHLSRTFLTTDYQEGVNLGYIFWDVIGVVVAPPQPGWIPVPGQGLAPMYRWRVAHRSGTNYYYSGGLWPDLLANPENTLEGIAGYALVPGATVGSSGIILHLWYSQENGYFYSVNGSLTIPAPPPPGPGSYRWQGVAYTLPAGLQSPFGNCIPAVGCFLFTAPPPPPPPPTCNPELEQACYNNGGTWNPSSCSCTYPVDPCLNSGGQGLRPIMPCLGSN
jgi:hypothetical protein